jgi:hypothetical protein
MSHAMLLESLDTGGVWSVARGLARNVEAYKRRLADADGPRRNDLDGRGNLSEEALRVREVLSKRVHRSGHVYGKPCPARSAAGAHRSVGGREVRIGTLPPKSTSILEAILYRGELPRGEAAGVVGASERHARRIVSTLIERGVLTAESARAPLRLVFPAALASRWMPGLFPEKPNEDVK